MPIQSERVQKALALINQQFKRLFGVNKETFHFMRDILQHVYEKLHQHGGGRIQCKQHFTPAKTEVLLNYPPTLHGRETKRVPPLLKKIDKIEIYEITK